jgi:phospholipid/cholesterol/gamma-HCH transport system substrate-binding protein
VAQQRFTEVKVGVFLLVALAVAIGLIMQFGKLTQFGKGTYEITVVFPNASGIIKDANVLYAGIVVGKVREMELDQTGALRVKVKLAIKQGVKIRRDAQFIINQSGLLGDRFVDINPQGTTAEFIPPGAEVEGTTTVDLNEAVRKAVDVLREASGTIQTINQAVKRIDEIVLSTQSLAHVTAALANVDATTSNTVALTASLGSIVETNRAKVDEALTDLSKASKDFSAASKRVEELVQRVDTLVVTNAPDVQAAITNLTASAERLNMILTRLEKGEGTAGKLLVDPKLHDDLLQLIEKINRYGFFYNTWIGPRLDRRPKTEQKPTLPAEQGKPPATNFGP